jgi:hypothetical protein
VDISRLSPRGHPSTSPSIPRASSSQSVHTLQHKPPLPSPWPRHPSRSVMVLGSHHCQQGHCPPPHVRHKPSPSPLHHRPWMSKCQPLSRKGQYPLLHAHHEPAMPTPHQQPTPPLQTQLQPFTLQHQQESWRSRNRNGGRSYPLHSPGAQATAIPPVMQWP